MGRGSIEVSVYEEPRRSPALAASYREEASLQALSRDSGSRLAGAAVAALLSLVLHGLLVTSMFWGAGSPATRPRDIGALDVVTPEAADDGALQVTIVQDPSSAPGTAAASANTAVSAAPAIVAIPFSNALSDIETSLPDISIEPARSVSTPAPDAAVRSAMYGRYVGQIDARIERAWLRPRTAIGATTFVCIVRIDQDSRGTVQEVTLEQCNGDERWQRSLVSAIESASPLPAPPDPAVFTRTVHLSFQSDPYSPGAPEDAYEPLSAAAQIGAADRDHPQRSP
jgi:hypothetical protein